MVTPEEKREGGVLSTNPGKDRLRHIKTVISNVFEQRGETAALQLVATLRKNRLPILPKLCTPDPKNPTRIIEEADALIIGKRITESRGRRGQEVILIALFPEEAPFVEFRSYGRVISEQVPGRTLLVPEGRLIEGHQLIFTKAENSTQQELIMSALEAIYRQRAGESPLLKS